MGVVLGWKLRKQIAKAVRMDNLKMINGQVSFIFQYPSLMVLNLNLSMKRSCKQPKVRKIAEKVLTII